MPHIPPTHHIPTESMNRLVQQKNQQIINFHTDMPCKSEQNFRKLQKITSGKMIKL